MSNRRMNVKRHMAKVIAMLMCFVIFTTSVDITAFAFTSDGDSDKVIVRIDSLSDEIANQKVKTDATLDDISLPASLDVHVTYQTEKEVVDEDEDTIEPSTEVVSQEESQVESTTDDELTEEEDSNDAQDEESDEEQITEVAGANYDSIVTAYVPMKYYAAEPSENDAAVETLEEADSQAEAKDETITEEVTEDTSVAVTWSVDEENSDKAEFKDLKVGEKYIFVPTITEDGYTLDDDIELPTIEVTVDEKVPAFEKSVTVDGVVITVTADDGVFPNDATIEARKVTASEENEAAEAIDEVRDDAKNVALSYTFDITVYDKDGNEIEPDTEEGSVKVTFKMAEIANENLETDVYHLEETDGGLNAENLDVNTEDGEEDEAVVETTGFSFYTVEFTYNELQYVLEGDERVELSAILDAVGIKENGEISKVEGSNDKLFKPVFEENVWYIEALKAFSSEEWLKVTIDEIEYEIVVTDSTTHIHDSITFDAWNETDSLPSSAGNYYLTQDITLSGTWNVPSGETNLCLNGYVINGNKGNYSVVTVGNGATLNLYDCDTRIEADRTHVGYIADGLWNLGTGSGTAQNIIGGVITGGKAANSHGAGVHICSGGTLNMNGGTIAGCLAQSYSYGCGGGAFVDGGTFIMNGYASIRNCKAESSNTGGGKGNGAGVYIIGSSSVFTMNDNASIRDCVSSMGGGGVRLQGGQFTMNDNALVSGCSALAGGGVQNIPTECANNECIFTMNGGVIENNTANSNVANWGGAGICINNGVNIINNGVIRNNTVNTKLGAGILIYAGMLTIEDCTISGNTGAQDGGGIYISGGTVTMNGGNISDNSCLYSGGGIYITSAGTLYFNDGVIEHNTTSADQYGGGGICNCGTCYLNGGRIQYNVAASNLGGGVCIFTPGVTYINGCTISNNTAAAGGGVHVNTGTLNIGKATKICDNVIGGTVTGNDGAYSLTGGTINNLYIPTGKTVAMGTGDNAPVAGMLIGVTLQSGTGNVTAVSSNTESYVGYFNADNVNYAVVKDTTNKNIIIIDASSYVAVINETGTLYTTVQDAINAATAGQTIKMIKDSNENVAVNKSIILDLNGKMLKGTGSGSVVTISNSFTLTLVDSYKTAAHTGELASLPEGGVITGATSGGGVYVNSGATFNMSDGAIYGNKSTCGGGVFVAGGTFNMTGGLIKNNSLTVDDQSGAGVFIGSAGNFEMSGGTISSNNGGSWGGGVNINCNCKFKMSGGTISGNKSKNGGGVFVGNGVAEFEMIGGTISGNEATNDGGGVYAGNQNAKLLISGGTISSNVATQNGGGVYVNNIAGGFIMNNGTISGNTASNGNGGGVYLTGNNTQFTLGGTAKITGNKKGDANSNLYLPNGKTITVATGTDVPATGMKIGVTTQTAPTTAAPVQVSGTNSTDYSSYFISDDPDYSVKTDSNVLKLMRNVATVTTAPQAKTSLKYNASAQSLVTAGVAEHGTMKYALGTDGTTAPTDASAWGTAIPTRTAVGTYYVWYKSAGDTNYADSTPLCVSVTVAKGTHAVTAPTALNPVYSGEEHALISAGSCTTGTIKYSFDGGDTYTESIDSIKATEIGSYTVYYKVEGDTNYENYGPMQLTAKIVKKSEPAPKPDPTPTPEPDDLDPQPVTPTVRYAETGKPVKNYVVNNSTGSKTPLPYITTDGSKAGWKTIDEALDAHKAKYKKKAVGTLSVTMNGSATVDPKLITDAHEKKIPLSFVLDDEVTVGVPIANTVLSEQVKAGTTPYFSVSSMTTAEAKSVKKAHAGLSPSDITAIGGDENTPVVLILCSNSENNGKKSQLITITFDAAKAGYKKGDMVYLYCGTSVEGIAMYKIGKVDRNGFVTFSVPMVNSYWTIGSVNMKNRLLRKNITMSR